MDDERPTFGSLFAGIGGIDLGLERAGWRALPALPLAGRWPGLLQRRLWPMGWAGRMTGLIIDVEQRSQDWLDVRRGYVTASDIGVLLGLSPWKSEATLADEKLNGTRQAETVPMRLGTILEPLIAELVRERDGRDLRRFGGMVIGEAGILAASPDFLDDAGLVETKFTTSRSRFADGLPQDIEAQVQVQMGCTGIHRADVAVLAESELLPLFPMTFDPDLFAHLETVAADFLRRLAAGGPFAHDAASLKAAYPVDNGAELVADASLTETVHGLLAVRSQLADLEAVEKGLEVAIKSRMGEFARMVGPDFTATWKRTKDAATIDWQSIADGLLRQLPEPERTALVGMHTTARPGFRPFRVVTRGDKT